MMNHGNSKLMLQGKSWLVLQDLKFEPKLTIEWDDLSCHNNNDIYNKLSPGQKFFSKSFILHYTIFCFEKQLFCKSNFVIRENDLFGMCSSVIFTPKCLVSADSPDKFYLLFLPLGSAMPESTRILSRKLNDYSKLKFPLQSEINCFH